MKKTFALKKRRGPIGPAWLRCCLFAAASACMGLAVAGAMQWIFLGTLPAVLEWALDYPAHLLMTALLWAVPVLVLGTLTGRLWIAALPVGAAGLILALVDYFKNAINGSPLELADFGLADQAGNVAGLAGDLTPPEDFYLAAAGLAFCVLILFLTRRITALEGTARARACLGSLALAGILLTGAGTRGIAGWLGVDFYTRLKPAENHSVYGLTLSLWRDAFPQPKTPPEGYDREYMQEVLARVDQLTEARELPEARPNILFILSESFYDLTRLPVLRYDGDPLENFHALEAESVSGTFHSHYLGYGTGYLEIPLLYGLNSTDLPPGTNICFQEPAVYQRFDALAEQYTNSGDYAAEMLHGFDNSLYNRVVNYPLLGFQNLYFHADIKEMGIERPDGLFGGYYMRDGYLFQAMLKRMEAVNAAGKRAFLFGITMENHQPFKPDKFNYGSQVPLIADELTPVQRDYIRVMLEGITRADRALGELTEALRQSPEPTVVVFFGDHRPNLVMPGGDMVYTLLGLCPENDSASWTIEQINELYSTDYLIWANDPALLGDLAGTRRESSITALGPQLLELTGWPVSRYWALLEKAGEAALTETGLYFVDGEGRPSFTREEAELSPGDLEVLELRDAVMYDAVYGKQYITEQMNLPPGS